MGVDTRPIGRLIDRLKRIQAIDGKAYTASVPPRATLAERAVIERKLRDQAKADVRRIFR